MTRQQVIMKQAASLPSIRISRATWRSELKSAGIAYGSKSVLEAMQQRNGGLAIGSSIYYFGFASPDVRSAKTGRYVRSVPAIPLWQRSDLVYACMVIPAFLLDAIRFLFYFVTGFIRDPRLDAKSLVSSREFRLGYVIASNVDYAAWMTRTGRYSTLPQTIQAER